MDEKGYIVPNPIDPHELICFKVYVPKDTLYIGAFWQAYQYFTSWLAWARDPLKKGKAAAIVWRTAYDKARKEFELNKGTCEMNITGLRQNPNNPCELQVEFDGNNQWQTVADVSKCMSCGGGGSTMQYDGLNVTIFNDCNGQFEPQGTPFNPQTQGQYTSKYADGENGACDGAANMAAYVHIVAQKALEALSTGATIGEAATGVISFVLSGAGLPVLYDILLAAFGVMAAFASDLYDDAAAEDITGDVKNIIFHHINPDGTIVSPNNVYLNSEMEANKLAQTPDTGLFVRWACEELIIEALGPYILSQNNKYAGIVDADCASSGWTQTFDFRVSRAGWFNIPDEANPDGQWVSGQGWKTTKGAIDTRTSNAVRLQTFIPSRTITRISYTYDAVAGLDAAHPTENANFIGYNGDDLSLVWEALIPAEDGEIGWSGSQVMTEVRLGEQVGTIAPSGDPLGNGRIITVTITGEGTNPFS